MAPRQRTEITAPSKTHDKARPPQARNFLDLPAELRLQIYADVLPDEEFETIARPALLQSSDFIFDEASDLYCKRLAEAISESEQQWLSLIKRRNRMAWWHGRDAEYEQMVGKIEGAEKRTNDLMRLARREAKLLGYHLTRTMSGEVAMRKAQAPKTND